MFELLQKLRLNKKQIDRIVQNHIVGGQARQAT